MAAYLVQVVDFVVLILSIILIVYALSSFVLDPWHPARQFLGQLAEPILRPFRNLIPPVGMFDLSIMVALIVIQILAVLIKALIVSAFS